MKIKSMKQILSIVLCTAMMSSLVGCTNAGDVNGGSDTDGTQTNIDADIDGGGSTGAATSVSNVEKVAVDDFYLYSNEDWINANQLESDEILNTRNDERDELLWSRMDEIFNGLSPEDFSEDDPMRKMIEYYNQFKDVEQREEISMTEIKSMTDKVLNISNMNQLQELMEDETYSLFNNICYISFEQDYASDYIPTFRPAPLLKLYYPLSDENNTYMTESIAKEFEVLGYSETEAAKIAQNAVDYNKRVQNFYSTTTGGLYGYGNDNENWGYSWADVDCTVDLQAICEANNYQITNKFSAEYTEFMIYKEYIDWLNENVNNSTLDMVKAYYAVNVVDMLSICGSNELTAANASIGSRICGVDALSAEDMDSYSEPSAQTLYYDRGAVAAYYSDKYITDEQIAETQEMISEIVDGYVELIEEVDWLNTTQKERLKSRTKLTKYLIGCYEEYNHLEDMEICDSLVDTCISLLKSNRRFDQRCLVKENSYVLTTYNVYTCNAYYSSESNSVLIFPGYYADDYLWGEASYEERMGEMGSTIAHELGHAYDYNRVAYRNNGEYDDRWDDYWTQYVQTIDKIYYYYNEMETANGNVLNGGMIYNEAFADIIGMDATLRALEKHDNVDYPVFFTSFARLYGVVVRSEYEELLVTQDTHVTSLERVNGTLAQFAKFYEYYDLSKDSKFYTEEADRIVPFAYVEE